MTDAMRERGYRSASDIAKLTGKHLSTIHRWLDSGKVSGVRVGGTRFISEISLIKFLGAEAAAVLGMGSKPNG